MPGDPHIILPAMAAAALVAIVLVLATGPWRAPQPTRTALGWVLGISAAFNLGAHLMGLLPEWGVKEVRHRMLFVVVPAAIVVELIAAFAHVPRWVAGPLRVVVAAGAGMALLHGSVDLERWTTEEKSMWLGGLAAAPIVVWSLLGLLMHLAPSRGVPLALAVVCAGAAVTIMFSGSATDGQLWPQPWAARRWRRSFFPPRRKGPRRSASASSRYSHCWSAADSLRTSRGCMPLCSSPPPCSAGCPNCRRCGSSSRGCATACASSRWRSPSPSSCSRRNGNTRRNRERPAVMTIGGIFTGT
jgi:hypothetical protein